LGFRKSDLDDCREERKAERQQKHAVGDGVDSFHDSGKVVDAVRKFHDETVRVVHRSDFATQEYGIHSREAAERGTELDDSPFGQPIPLNTSQYGPFLATPPDPDEVPVTSPISQQEDLRGLSPPCTATQNARASDARLSSPTTDMADSATGDSSSNIYHPSRLDQLNGDSPSRPNSFANVRVLLLAKSCLFTFDPMLTQSSMH
jgi:hypothetical protein